MKLTKEEKQEQVDLQTKRDSTMRLMLESEHHRYEYLNQKYWHNQCSNLKCIGWYSAEEIHTECVKCNYKLIKSVIMVAELKLPDPYVFDLDYIKIFIKKPIKMTTEIATIESGIHQITFNKYVTELGLEWKFHNVK